MPLGVYVVDFVLAKLGVGAYNSAFVMAFFGLKASNSSKNTEKYCV